MSVERIAALPMYDFPDVADTHDALWSAVAERLTRAGMNHVPRALTRDMEYADTWRHPGLVLGQACEYPLAKFHAEHVRLVATPRYRVAGCEGSRYRSAIVMRKDDPTPTILGLRDLRCVVNQRDSNSGMNLLRAAIAPVAGGGKFFRSVQVSGSHWRSAWMVAHGEADVAALDCVSFAHLQRCDAPVVQELRILAWTPASPSLPFITSRATDDATFERLREVLAQFSVEPALAEICGALFLDGVDCEPDADFTDVLRLEREAEKLGYPALV